MPPGMPLIEENAVARNFRPPKLDGNSVVAYERLLLPFGSAGAVSHLIGSFKAISMEGGFKIKDLLSIRPNDRPVILVRAVIDRDVARATPGHRLADDLEFS